MSEFEPTPLGDIVGQGSASKAQETAPVEKPSPDPVVNDEQPLQSGEKDGPPPQDAQPMSRADEGKDSALKAERVKRQELEARLEQYERLLKQQQQSQPEAEPEAGFYEDPEGFVNRRLSAVEEKHLQRTALMSEELVKAQFPDYADAAKAFVEVAQADPALAYQMKTSPNPALFAYQMGKQIAEARALQADPTSYRAKIEADIRAKIEAEYAEKAKADEKLSLAARQSINSARDGGGRFKAETFTGPTPLSQILGPKRR
jgi:hypothetical protein